MSDENRIGNWLREHLMCPVGKSPLTHADDELVCECGLGFPIRDGILVMRPEEARLPEGIKSPTDVPCLTDPSDGPAP